MQVGWQVEPGDRVLVQSPTAPFSGAALASQVIGSQVAGVNETVFLSRMVESPFARRSTPSIVVSVAAEHDDAPETT